MRAREMVGQPEEQRADGARAAVAVGAVDVEDLRRRTRADSGGLGRIGGGLGQTRAYSGGLGRNWE